MAKGSNHAIVFGASGLIGWSAVNQLLSGYPSPGTFSKVTAVTNRPVPESELYWPQASPARPRLELVSGVNLLDDRAEQLIEKLRRKVTEVDQITHVFYFVFAPYKEDHIRECSQNVGMLRRVAEAMNAVAPVLRSFVYSGGTRGYGIYVPGGTFTPPLVESMADCLPESYAKTVAYPWFRMALAETSKGHDWTWTEVCPDAVVGFSPHGSAFSLALHWAQYLSLYAYNNGVRRSHGTFAKRVEVPFPGNHTGYNSLSTPVSEKTLGRISIYAALHPDECGERVLNAVDQDGPSSFRDLWPSIAGWFGLVGVGPSGDDDALKPGEYIAKYQHLFAENGLTEAANRGVGAGSSQLDSVGWWLDFDRQLSPERLRATGFMEQRDPVEGWLDSFERFAKAGIIFE